MKKLIFLGVVLFFSITIQAQKQTLIDSLENELKRLEADQMKSRSNVTNEYDSSKVNLLNKISEAYNRSKPEVSKSTAEKALALSTEIDYKKGTGASIINIGRALESLGNNSKALEHYNKAFIVYYELGDKNGIANSYRCIGNIYSTQANYSEALKNYLASLKIVEAIGNKRGVADVTNNIGTIYNQQKNFEEARKYFLTTLKIYEELGEKDGIASTYINIGNIYSQDGNFEEALKFFSRALKIFEKLGNTEFMAAAYVNIGIIYSGQKNYPEALKNQEKSKELFETLGNKWGVAVSCHNIGGLLIIQKKYTEADEYISKSLQLSKEMGAFGLRAENYKLFARLDSCLGKHEEEILHFKAYVALRDSMKTIESSKKFTQLQIQYDFEKQEMLSKAAKEQEDKMHEHKELMEYLGIFCFIIFLFALLLLFTRLNVSGKTFDMIGFIGVLLFFQFLESVIHPKIYPFIHGSPILFILFNIILASAIKPLHHIIEHRLKAFSAKRKEKNNPQEIILAPEGSPDVEEI